MKYFLPDSQDLVDPSFDFRTERRARSRLRQRDDLYAHEVFHDRPFDGLLVSKGIVDGSGGSGGRYTLAQRQRLLRSGAQDFFRARFADGSRIPVIGDCGAFTYVKEEVPPYSVDEVVSFYAECGFDLGISVDHVILAFDPDLDAPDAEVPQELRSRQELTLELATKFAAAVRAAGKPFEPLGVAQGWSPASYAHAVSALQRMGYDYIAVGGMVPLKTPEILQILEGIAEVRKPATRLHLLGVTRLEQIRTYEGAGVASFDSTSPLRQAFKDQKHNYYTPDRTYVAIRIPQVEGNPSLQRRIASGEISQDAARAHERAALAAMEAFQAGRASVAETLEVVLAYEKLYDDKADHSAAYRETLEAAPWRNCACEICRELGHHVILFRGAERNRRRGLHNVWTLYRRLQHALDIDQGRPSEKKAKRRRPQSVGADP